MNNKVKHIALILVAIGIPIVTAIQVALGHVQLGAGASVGVVAAGFVAVLTNLRGILPKPSAEEQTAIAKWANRIGLALSVASPILVIFESSAGVGTKTAIVVATVSGLLARLKEAFPATPESAKSP